MNEEEEMTEQERYYLDKPWLTENPLPDILELKNANQHENGKFSCKGYYGNGMDEGLSEYDWPNVNKNEEETGFWKKYEEDGKLEAEGNYENGECEGIWRFFTNGKLTSELYFENGEAKN